MFWAGREIAIDLRRSGIERIFSESDYVGTNTRDMYGKSVCRRNYSFL